MVRNGETVRCETFRFVVVLEKRNDVSEYKRGVALSGREVTSLFFFPGSAAQGGKSMASQTEVLKALHGKDGPTKTADLAKELKTSDDTVRALISKLKKKAFVDGDAKEGWYITDAGIKPLGAGETIPTTIKDVGKDELSMFKYYGQLAGAEPDDIAAAAELFQNSDMRSMAEVARVLAEVNVPMTSRTKWINLYRGYLRNTTLPEIRDELYPLPTPEERRVLVGEGTGVEEVTKGERLDYIVEGNEIHRVGDGLGEFTFRQALQVVAAKRGSVPKAEGDGGLTGALSAFAEALKNVGPSQPLTIQDVINIINTMKENQSNPGEASVPGYVDEDGEWHELKPGQPVILKRSATPPSSGGGSVLVIKQTPEGIVTEEHKPGEPIIINSSPPPAGNTPGMMPMMPFPVIGGDGKPVVDQDGRPVYANIQPMLEWLKFQGEQRRSDQRHEALIGLAQTVRENLGDGVQALKAAAQEFQKGGVSTAAKQGSPQTYECGTCHTQFALPQGAKADQVKCPGCGAIYTKEQLEGGS